MCYLSLKKLCLGFVSLALSVGVARGQLVLVNAVEGYKDESFLEVAGITVDRDGRQLMVADAGAKRIYVFSTAGDPLRVMPLAEDIEAVDIELGTVEDQLFILDARGYLVVLNYEGEELRREGPLAEALGEGVPRALALGRQGEIFLLGAEGQVALRRKGQAEFARWYQTEDITPRDLAVDSFGRLLFIGDGLRSSALYDLDGRYLFSPADRLSGVGRIAQAGGVCVDAEGRIWIGDVERHVLNVFDQEGNYLFEVETASLRGGSVVRISKIIADRQQRFYIMDMNLQKVFIYEDTGGYPGD